jgi:cyanophycinase
MTWKHATAAAAVLVFVFEPCVVVEAVTGVVAIGGGLGDDNHEVWGKFVELAGGRGVARVGVITASSGDPEDAWEYYSAQFERYGVASVEWVNVSSIDRENNRDPLVLATISRQTGFFFGGGDQMRHVLALFDDDHVPSPAMLAIRSTLASTERGAVGGSSAGCSVLVDQIMVTQGTSWYAVLYGATTDPQDEDTLAYLAQGGVAYFPFGLLDQHFSYRGREARLARLLADTQRISGLRRGFGIDEDVALVLDDLASSHAYVLGGAVGTTDGVVVMELPPAATHAASRYVNRSKDAWWRIDGLRVSFLTEGDTVNLETGEVRFASWKSPLSGRERHSAPQTSEDIFSTLRRNDGEFQRISTRLFDSRTGSATHGVTRESDPVRYRVDLSRSARDAVGYFGIRPEDGNEFFSYQGLLVSIGADDNTKIDVATFNTTSSRASVITASAERKSRSRIE